MIKLSHLNGKTFYLNSDLFEYMEERPDTTITLTTGKKLVVAEDADTVLERIVKQKQLIFLGLPEVIKQELEQEE